MTQEYKFIGMNMERVSFLYGLFLVLWGLIVSSLSNSTSFTSYIPSMFGIFILVFALLAIVISSKKKLNT